MAACGQPSQEAAKLETPTAAPLNQQPAITLESTATPTKAATVPTPAPQPKEAPSPAPDSSSVEPSSAPLAFEDTAINFDYRNDWRISSRTDNSVVFTLKESPGNAVLSLEWQDGVDSNLGEFTAQFEERLRLYALEVEPLEDFRIGDLNAKRFASFVQRGNQKNVVLNVIFQSDQRFYMATFAAEPEEFGKYASIAMETIEGFVIP